jgi:hypothetical protein
VTHNSAALLIESVHTKRLLIIALHSSLASFAAQISPLSNVRRLFFGQQSVIAHAMDCGEKMRENERERLTERGRAYNMNSGKLLDEKIKRATGMKAAAAVCTRGHPHPNAIPFSLVTFTRFSQARSF